MDRMLLQQIKDVANGVIRNGANVAGARIVAQKNGAFSGQVLATNKAFNGMIKDGVITRLAYGGVLLIQNGKYTLAGEREIK